MLYVLKRLKGNFTIMPTATRLAQTQSANKLRANEFLYHENDCRLIDSRGEASFMCEKVNREIRSLILKHLTS